MYTQTQVLDDSDFDDLPRVNSRVKLGILKTVDRDYEIFIGLNCIGRADICDIVIKHPSISGKHAIIEIEDQESHIIYDCGSTNKTKLGKVKLKPNLRYNLQDGDVITFGHLTATYVKVNETPAQNDDDSGSDTGSESLFCDSIVPETPYQTKLVNLISSEIIVAATPDSSKNTSENEDSFLTSIASVSNMETPSVNRAGSNKMKNNIKGTKIDFVDETISETVSKPPELVLGPDMFGDDEFFDDDIIPATQHELLNNTTLSNYNDANSSVENISTREKLKSQLVNLKESLNFKIRQENEEKSQDSIFNLSTQVPKSQRFSDILFFSQDPSFSRKSGQSSTKNEETANVLQLLESRDPIFVMDTQEPVSDKNVCIVKEQVSSRRTSNRIKRFLSNKNIEKDDKDVFEALSDEEEIYNAKTQVARNYPICKVSTDSKACTSNKITDTKINNDVYEALTQVNHNLLEKNVSREDRDVKDNTDDLEEEIYNAKTQVARNYQICEVSTDNKACTSNKITDTKTNNDVYEALTQVNHNLLEKNVSREDRDVKDNTDDLEEIYNAKTQVARNYQICEVSTDSKACTSNKITDTKTNNDVYEALTQVNHNLLEKNVSREDRDVKDNTDDLEEEIYNAKTQVARNYQICEVSTDSKACTSNKITDTKTNNDVYEALTQVNHNLLEKNVSREDRDVKDNTDDLEEEIYNAKTQVARNYPICKVSTDSKACTSNKITDTKTNNDVYEALTQVNHNLLEKNVSREDRDVKDNTDDLEEEIYNAKTQVARNYPICEVSTDSKACTSNKITDTKTNNDVYEALTQVNHNLLEKNVSREDRDVKDNTDDLEEEIYNAKTQVARNYPICEVSTDSKACTSNKITDTKTNNDVYEALTQVSHNLLEKNVSREDRNVKDNTDDLEEEVYNAKTQVARNYPICEDSTDSKACTSNKNTDTKTSDDVYEALTQVNYNLGEKNLSGGNGHIKDSPDNVEVATYNAKTQAASSKISLSSDKNTTKTPLKNEVKLLVEDKVHQNTPFEFRTQSSRNKKRSKVTDNKLLLSPQNITQNPLLIMNSKTVDRQAQNPTFDLQSQVADSETLTQVNTKLSDSKSNQLIERMKREEKPNLFQNPESLIKMNSKTSESKEKHDSIFEMDTQVPDFDALIQINPKLSDSKRKSSKERKTSQVKTSVVENPESLLEGKEKPDPIFEMDTQVPDFDELTQINPKLNDSKNKLTREKRNRQVKASIEKNIESVLEDKEMENIIFEMDTQVPDFDALTQINLKLSDLKNKPTREKKSRRVKNSTEKNLESVLENKEIENPIFDMDAQVSDSDALTQINPKLNNSKNKLNIGKKSRKVKTSVVKNLESVLENNETQNLIFDMDTQVPDSDALTQINSKLNNSKNKLNSGKKSRKVKTSVVKNLESVLENNETQNAIFNMDTQVPDSDALTQINPKLNNSKSKLNSEKKSRQVKNSTEKNLESGLENKETQNPIIDMDTQVPDFDALTQINPKLNNSKSKLNSEKKSRQVKNSTEKNLESVSENKETQNPIFDMDTQVPDFDALTQINPKLNNSKSKLNSGKKSRQVKNSTENNLESVSENKETQNPIFDMDTQVPDFDALTQINPKLNNSKSKLNSGKKSRQVKNSTEKNLESVSENKETQNPIFDMDTQVPDFDALTQINPKLKNSKSKLNSGNKSRQVKNSTEKNLESVSENKETQNPIFDMDTQVPDSDTLIQINPKLSNSKSKLIREKKSRQVKTSVVKNLEAVFEGKNTQQHPIFEMDTQLPDSDVLTQVNTKISDKSRTSKNKCEVRLKSNETNKSVHDIQRPYNEAASTRLEDDDLEDALTQINYNLQEKHPNRNVQNNQVECQKSKTQVSSSLSFSKSIPISPKDKQIFKALTQINHSLQEKNESEVNRGDQNDDDSSYDIDEDLIFSAKIHVSNSAPVSKMLPVNKNKEAGETDVFEALTQINYNLEVKNVVGVNRDDQNIDDNSTDIDEDSIFNTTKVSSSASVSKILPVSKNKEAEDTGVFEALTQINYNLQDKSETEVDKIGQNVNMDVELPGIRRLPIVKNAIPKTCAINNLDIDEENHESESILAIVSDDLNLDDMDDEDNLFEVTHSDKNKNLLDCVSNKQLKNNNEISKTEMSVGDNLSDDEMISHYSDNSFNLPPSDVLLEAIANYEATLTPGEKPSYTDDEDEEEIINSPPAKRRTTRIRKPTNKVGMYLDSSTTIKKVAKKKKLKIKTNDSMCNEKAQKEAVKIKNPVVKLKPISIGEIELFTGQNKLKENNSKEILDDRVTSSLKSKNASKKYSAEEKKLMEVGRKVCESEKRVDNTKENSGENTRERPENEGFDAVQNGNNDRSNKSKIKGEKPNNLLLMNTTEANQSIKVNDAGNSSSNDVRAINTSKTSKVDNVPFVTKSTRNRKVSRSEEKDETILFKTGHHEKSHTSQTKTGTSSAKVVDTSKTEQHEKSHTNNTNTGTSSAKAVDPSKTGHHEKSHTNKTKTGITSAKAVDTSKTEQHEKSHTNNTNTGNSSAKAVDTSKTGHHEKSHTNKTKTGTSSTKAVDTSKTEESEKTNIKDTEKKQFHHSHSSKSSETLGKDGTEKVTRRRRIPKKDLRNEAKEGTFRITRSTLKAKEVNEKESKKIHSKLEKKDEMVNSNKKYVEISLDRPTRRKPENVKEQSSTTEITNISKSDSTHSLEDEKGKRVCRKTKGENNLTDDIPVKKSKRIATQKQLSTIKTVDLVKSNDESDLEPLSKIKKRGRNLKNLTSKSKRAKYDSCIQPETGVTIIEPNSSVVYDSPLSCINTKTDSLLVECTTSYKSENVCSKADKVNKIVKKNTTAQRKRNIDEFFLPVASMSRVKDSVSYNSEEKTSSFSNISGSFVHSISSPTTRNIGRRKEQVLFTTDMADPKLMAIVTKLGCTIVNSPQTCTVLVTDKIRRTVKVLCCVGRGIPIVSQYWIEESKYVGIVQDPWKYLIVDKEAENKHTFSLKKSLNKANKVPLLKNYSIHATPSVRPPPCELRGIVEASGGVFLDEIPKLWPENSIIISCNEDRNLWEKVKRNTVPLIVTAEALIGGVLQQNLNLKYHTLS